MAIDWPALFRYLHVPFTQGGSNTIAGCTTVKCPFCPADDPDHSMHCNFSPDGRVKCWRCRGGSHIAGVARLGGYTFAQAAELVREYGGATTVQAPKKDRLVGKASSVVLPGSEKLRDLHTSYLVKRGFDPDELKFRYGIRGTGPMERWEGIDFQLRVIIPIFDADGNLVNFQGRDVTGRQELRYKCCPVEKAVKHHKHTLYGAHLWRNRRRVVVVEGVFDQWRLGPGSVCTFGTSVTKEQVLLLSNWKEVVLAFDDEPEAQRHAREIAAELSVMGTQVVRCRPNFGLNADGSVRDPGDLTTAEAEEYMRYVGVR